jgi:hypothetical protein
VQVTLQTLVEENFRGRLMSMFTLVRSLMYLNGFLLNTDLAQARSASGQLFFSADTIARAFDTVAEQTAGNFRLLLSRGLPLPCLNGLSRSQVHVLGGHLMLRE